MASPSSAAKKKNGSPGSPWNRESPEAFFSYSLLGTPKGTRRVGLWVLVVFAVGFSMLFLPWQQNIQAKGEVTALSPDERPQVVPSAIDGMLVEWFVQEGQAVRKGDSLARIIEIKDKYLDPNLLQRLREQIVAKQGVIDATLGKVMALRDQYAALENGLRFKFEQATNKVVQSRLKVTTDSAAVVAQQTAIQIAQIQFDRVKALFDQGLKSRAEFESADLKLQEAIAKLVEAQNKLGQSRQDLAIALVELSSVRADYQDKMAKALAERQASEAYVNDARSEIAKLQNELANMAARREFHIIRAPQDGYVVQATRRGVGENVKAGDPVLSIVPIRPMLAVELFVTDTDMPLVAPGDKARLHFDGWPALQVSGWPSVSVGTFGGEIAVVDRASSDGQTYRVLVRPDTTDEQWPVQLRMGSGVYAWAMLDEVPLWYELWRQLNGFPPSRQNPAGSGGGPAREGGGYGGGAIYGGGDDAY